MVNWKSPIAAGLIAVILTCSVGIKVYKHYCLGTLKSVSLIAPDKCCPADTDMPCCSDSILEVKFDDSQPTSFEVSFTDQLIDFEIPFLAYTQLFHSTQNNHRVKLNDPPPLLTYPSAHLTYQVFLI